MALIAASSRALTDYIEIQMNGELLLTDAGLAHSGGTDISEIQDDRQGIFDNLKMHAVAETDEDEDDEDDEDEDLDDEDDDDDELEEEDDEEDGDEEEDDDDEEEEDEDDPDELRVDSRRY